VCIVDRELSLRLLWLLILRIEICEDWVSLGESTYWFWLWEALSVTNLILGMALDVMLQFYLDALKFFIFFILVIFYYLLNLYSHVFLFCYGSLVFIGFISKYFIWDGSFILDSYLQMFMIG
jgi:hypothetical protein